MNRTTRRCYIKQSVPRSHKTRRRTELLSRLSRLCRLYKMVWMVWMAVKAATGTSRTLYRAAARSPAASAATPTAASPTFLLPLPLLLQPPFLLAPTPTTGTRAYRHRHRLYPSHTPSLTLTLLSFSRTLHFSARTRTYTIKNFYCLVQNHQVSAVYRSFSTCKIKLYLHEYESVDLILLLHYSQNLTHITLYFDSLFIWIA